MSMVRHRSSQPVRPHVRYHKLMHEHDQTFEAAFALYERTFPAEERTTREAFIRQLRKKRLGQLAPSNFHCIVALKEGMVVGMGCGSYLASANLGYVSYLVVEPEHTKQRLGPNIRNHLITAYKHDAELNGHERLEAIVGEVRADNRWLRILSGRGQVMALDIEYEQPRLRSGLERVPLVLYYQPVQEMPKSLPAAKVRAIVEALYKEIYKMEDPMERPVFRDFIRQLEGRSSIGHKQLKHGKG